MTNEEKAKELFPDVSTMTPVVSKAIREKMLEMAKWKDQQFEEEKSNRMINSKFVHSMVDYLWREGYLNKDKCDFKTMELVIGSIIEPEIVM